MMTIEERLDELLAASLAHHAVLEEIVEQVFPTPESKRAATESACAGFEHLDTIKEATRRSHLMSQKSMGLIERIFRGPPEPPQSQGLEDR